MSPKSNAPRRAAKAAARAAARGPAAGAAGDDPGVDESETLPAPPAAPVPLSSLARRYLDALLRAERHVASRLILDAVESGTSVRTIYLEVFQPTQHEIGRLWQANEVSIAQEHYCTAATQLIMSQLYARIFAAGRIGRSMVATCVSGDLHELGVRMVADFFEMEGWDTFYTGANTPHGDIVRALVERRADLLAVSATLGRHIGAVRDMVHAVRADARCRGVRILVGGYPFNRDASLWRQVGADAHAADAQAAVAEGTRLVGLAGGRARP